MRVIMCNETECHHFLVLKASFPVSKKRCSCWELNQQPCFVHLCFWAILPENEQVVAPTANRKNQNYRQNSKSCLFYFCLFFEQGG